MIPTTIMSKPQLVPALPVRSPAPAPSGTGGSTPGVPGWLTGYIHWASGLSDHLTWLGHHAHALWWPWAPLLALVVVLGTVAVRAAQAAAWRTIAADAYWVAVTPPRTVDPADWAKVWRRLAQLALRARGGRWRLVRPPLAFEVYATDGGLTAGVWLPGWVRYPDAASEIAMAWPGATVTRTDPPTMDSDGGRVAGYRLAASVFHPDTGWLVDDTRTPAVGRGAPDPMLGRMFAALGEPGGPVVLQVLIRPVGGRRRAHLHAASVRPVKAYRSGGRRTGDAVLWLLGGIPRLLLGLWDVATTKNAATTSRPGRAPVDPVQAEAMREARAKQSTPPHLLVSIRVGAVRSRRDDARAAAASVAGGFGDATAWLDAVRLPRPAAVLTARRARGSDWLLMTAAELGILAHLPPDPGRYRFDTTALVRPLPRRFRRADPERPGGREPGWTGHDWTPPGATRDDNGPDPDEGNESDPDDDGPEAT